MTCNQGSVEENVFQVFPPARPGSEGSRQGLRALRSSSPREDCPVEFPQLTEKSLFLLGASVPTVALCEG